MSKIEAILREGHNPLRDKKIYKALIKLRVFRKTKESLRRLSSAIFPYNYKLHDDPILRKAIKTLGEQTKISSIVETGTYLGSTASLLAEMFPTTPIYSSEINKKTYIKAKKNLRKYSNVKVINKSSPDFLNYIIDNKLIGKTPLFFLDAHWLNYWPLEDEINIITKKLKKSIIIIDDFKIPEDNRFKYDKYEDRECSLEMIMPKMNKSHNYNLLLPNYGREVFKDNKHNPTLVGYPIIFHNMEDFFKRFSSLDFTKKFFNNKSKLLKF